MPQRLLKKHHKRAWNTGGEKEAHFKSRRMIIFKIAKNLKPQKLCFVPSGRKGLPTIIFYQHGSDIMFKKFVSVLSISLLLVGSFSGCRMQKTANNIEVSADVSQYSI